jgi:hypothetical protein
VDIFVAYIIIGLALFSQWVAPYYPTLYSIAFESMPTFVFGLSIKYQNENFCQNHNERNHLDGRIFTAEILL